MSRSSAGVSAPGSFMGLTIAGGRPIKKPGDARLFYHCKINYSEWRSGVGLFLCLDLRLLRFEQGLLQILHRLVHVAIFLGFFGAGYELLGVGPVKSGILGYLN